MNTTIKKTTTTAGARVCGEIRGAYLCSSTSGVLVFLKVVSMVLGIIILNCI